MAIHRYTTKLQLEKGLDIISKPCRSSHTVNMDLSKNNTEGKNEHKLSEINSCLRENQSWNKENQAKLDSLLCLAK